MTIYQQQEKVYLTAEQWCRIICKTWIDSQFEIEFLSNPLEAVKQAFPHWKFTHMVKVPPKPDSIKTDLLNEIIASNPSIRDQSKAIVIPFNTSCC
jgi:hypothetical protein